MKNDNFQPNSYYLGLVQNLYAGSNGCILAFLQFLYQQILSKQNFPQFEDCFRTLQEKECENLQILGEIVLVMGGDPQFFSSSRKHFCAKSVNYLKSIDKIFLNDIELLEIEIVELKSTILKIEDAALKEKLRKVFENKKFSLKILKEEYFKSKIVK